MNMGKNMDEIKGLLVPISTPMYHGKFDRASMKKLVNNVGPYVSGYVPCLSSGEGQKMSDKLWVEVTSSIVKMTDKPIYVGVKRVKEEDTVKLIKKAKQIGCAGVTIPVPSLGNERKVVEYFQRLNKLGMDTIVYNTETASIKTVKGITDLDKIGNIIAVKDSSMNMLLFRKLVDLRKKEKLNLSISQGIEHLLYDSKGCDGYLISLLNLEPRLCSEMFKKQDKKTDKKIKDLFWEYNLGGEWYVTIKASLRERGIIKSAEEINPFIKP